MKGQEHNDIKFSLLGNGLDFISSALELLTDSPEPREVKYAILHLSAGIELVLKERLRREHWTLLFDKIDKANKQDYASGKFNSLNFNECLERLVRICGVQIQPNQKQDLLRFRDKRNRFEHFNILDSSRAVKASAAVALNFLWEFIQYELNPETLDRECLDVLYDIKSNLIHFESFVSERLKSIKSQIDSANFLIECEECFQSTVIIDEGSHCLFCGEKKSPPDAAHDYVTNVVGLSSYEIATDGGVWPIYNCPGCGDFETFVDYIDNNDDRISVCFNCGGLWDSEDLGTCDICMEPFTLGEDKSAIVCHSCFSARVGSLDD